MERHLPRDTCEVFRDEMYLKDRIADILRSGPKTIPELANALGLPSHEVMMIVMTMRRFGMVEELPKNKRDDYFQYRFIERTK
ncbi:MAG: MarR family transcriptional regulator [Dissulfurimicrobium sp.]|uniref:MarR family transcriptional regulator n=1 Tax=Dissulfurimicrobium sp. TaxID=2022436 RepID=UPI00404B9953